MKRTFLLLGISGLFCLAIAQQDRSDIRSYFNEVALGAEFGDTEAVIRKWSTDMVIEPRGYWPAYLSQELNQIIAELNALIEGVQVRVADSLEAPNYIIFIGDPNIYADSIEPSAQPYVQANYGMFWLYWENDVIYKGTMYVDPVRADTEGWQKHLLREELTQSLGLMNDSDKHKDSMFFQGRSFTTYFSGLDKELIRMLYHPDIRPGMDSQAAGQVIEELLKPKCFLIKYFKSSRN